MTNRLGRRLLLGLGAIAGVLAALPSAAGAQTGADQIQVLNVADGAASTVTVEVAIPPSIGKLAPVASNFGVTENGQLRQPQVGAVTGAVDVVIVMDTSGSMKGAGLTAAKAAATTFIQQLPSDARVGVVSFGDTASVQTPPSTDHARALQGVAGLQAGGETALWDAMVLAADTVKTLGSPHPYVVVLADGANSAGSATRDSAAARLTGAGARLYAIALATADTDRAALIGTVTAVGGQFLSTPDPAQLNGLYADIARRLSSRYQLTFPTQSGVARNVVVSVATQGAVATATVTLAATGPSPTADPAQPLSDARAAQLGAVTVGNLGWLGSGWLRYLGLASMFVAFVILALLMTTPAAQVRLDAASGVDQVAGLNARLSEATNRFVAKRDTDGELDSALDAAGINLRPGEFVLLSTAAVVILGLVFSLVGGKLLGVMMALLTVVLLVLYLKIRMGRQRQRFADQLTDALSIMASGLRAGRGLPQAIELVSQEAPSPLADQFRRIVFETRVGRDMTTSMMAAAQRMKSEDLQWITRAVDINRELGGDLVEVLENVADTIRERRRVERQVNALSAEGRATGWVLLSLPILLFLFITWRNPGFEQLLTGSTVGRVLLAVGVINMVIGYFWVRKLVNIKY